MNTSARVSVSAKSASKQLATKLKLDPSSTINGFNFSFASMLLAKLKVLIEEERLSQCESGREIVLTPISGVVVNRLLEQIPFPIVWGGPGCGIERSQIDILVETATEFLMIFEGNLK